jgi:hypothetical protein
MANSEIVPSDKANSRDAWFGDTDELTIVLVSDTATIRPDDSRKLRGIEASWKRKK